MILLNRASRMPASSPTVRLALTRKECTWFDAQLDSHHGLRSTPPVGDFLRQVVELDGRPVALLVWGPACYALKDRDRWIGWSAPQRISRLKLIVQNRRFLVLSPKGAAANLASQAMAAALRALPQQWQERFGYRPLLAESFTDPELHLGTTYKATNWIALGASAGFSRDRLDFYLPNDRPKRLWGLELVRGARTTLRGRELPPAYQAALSTVPGGVLPVSPPQMDSLYDAFAHVPDPRGGTNKRFRIRGVLTLVAMALLGGRREITEITRFAQSVPQKLRHRLALPLKKGTKAFYSVPGYSVFYQVLRRLDPQAFNDVLNQWLNRHASQLPQALALDGKMVRDHFGLLSLARHTDGAPQALARDDQREGTTRSEQSVAQELMDSLPALDGQVVSADALHCQRSLARSIVEKGGEYLLQIKGNQPRLEERARTKEQIPGTPFFQ
jgi:hypothetical protein